MKSPPYCFPISTKYGISRHIFVMSPISNFTKICPGESRWYMRTDGQKDGETGGHDKPNSPFSLFMQTRFPTFRYYVPVLLSYVRFLILTGYIHYVSSYPSTLRFLYRSGAFKSLTCLVLFLFVSF